MRKVRSGKFLISAYQYGADPCYTFINNMEDYAKHVGATIMIMPVASVPSEYEREDKQIIHPRVKKYIVKEDTVDFKNIWLTNINITTQAIKPLTGIPRIVAGNKSVIVPSTKQHMLVQATNTYPRVMLSTGCCHKPCYKNTRAGKIANFDHDNGFLYLEVDKKGMYNYRLVKSSKGSYKGIIDLGTKVDNKEISTVNASAVVLGDIHVGSINPKALDNAYELIKTHKPSTVVIHDLFDGKSINHHNKDKIVSSHVTYVDLVDELRAVGEFLQDLAKITTAKIVIVKSNHDEFLDRYIDGGKYDPKHLELIAKLILAKIKGKDPLVEAIKYTFGKIPKNVKFLTRDSSYKIQGYECANHGDLGANGSKNSIMQIQHHTGKSVTGHSHVPFVLGEAYGVGTTTNLKLQYNRGPSSWMNTHAVIWPNRTIQLINTLP